MAARFGPRLATLVVLLAASASVCAAQSLQRLHVLSFTLGTDVQSPQVGQPFDVTLTIHVGESVNHLDNVYLPVFSGAEELGDERQLAGGRGGTTYREILRLVAHRPGPIAVGSAYLDAIDARDGKPKRFISNSLRLGAFDARVSTGWPPLVGLLLWSLVAVAALGTVAYLPRWRTASPQPEPVSEAIAPAPPDPDEMLERALQKLRADRSREAVMETRAALWRVAHAEPGQTLGEVFRQNGHMERPLRRLLLDLERAAFTDELRLSDAIDEIVRDRGAP